MALSKKDDKVTIRLPLEMKEKLKVLAEKQNRKLSDFIFLELQKIIILLDNSGENNNVE